MVARGETTLMKSKIVQCRLLVALAVLAVAGEAVAGDEASSEEPSLESLGAETMFPPESPISRDDWKCRIEEACKRSEQARSGRSIRKQRVAQTSSSSDKSFSEGDLEVVTSAR